MNQYTYSELSVGHTESFKVTVTTEMMDLFFKVTGDCNPLHMSDDFAKERSNGAYPGRVVYGMLTASFLSTLAGVYLPGENSLIHRIEAEFPTPVYIGDLISFMGEITKKNDNFQIIEVKITGTNQANKKVCRGKMRIGVVK